jgi:hypothetical protein
MTASKNLAHSLPTAANRKTDAFKKLQDEWYRQALDSGLQDGEIHKGKDGHLTGEKNDEYLGTSRAEQHMVSLDEAESVASHDEHGDNAALQENLDVFGEVTTVWDTPTAQQWRFYGQEVEDLPANYPRRAFLVRWAELGGDVLNAAKQTGITRWTGREAVRKFKDRLRKLGRLR